MPREPLNEQQTQILLALFEGNSVANVAAKFGVSTRTVARIKERDDAHELQMKYVRNVFTMGAMKAARKLVEQIDDPNPWVAQNASRAVLDYMNKANEEVNHSIVVLFDNMGAPPEPPKVEDGSVVEADGEVE